MKVLWITNSPFPEIYEELYGRPLVSVGWVSSSANALLDQFQEIELASASIYDGDDLKIINKTRITHFLVPRKVIRKENDYLWQQVTKEFNPDVIHIHGSEYSHSHSYVRACGSKNVVVSIQGLVSVYERYYFGNIEKSALRRTITLRDIIRFDTIFSQQKNMYKRGQFEQLLIRNVNHIIGRTSWDRDHTWAINPKASYHFCNETLRPSFFEEKWDIKKCEKHSIFISQAQYPIKGFQQLVKALPIVLRHFPDTKVYVAGHNFFSGRGIRLHGFGKYINKMIAKLNLSEHIIFTGLLPEKEMCQQFLNSHLFVCPSAIENSPNSVGEAQILGVPCIASYVGGTADMVTDGETGLLYRFEEVEMLAANICRVFSDDGLALHLSEKGRKAAKIRHDKEKNAAELNNIYKKINAGN